MTALIQLDGVLRGVNGVQIMDGRFLLEGLRSIRRVVVMTLDSRTDAELWLKLNSVRYDDIIDASALIDPEEEPSIRQIQLARSGGKVDYVVSSDPSVAAWCLTQGVTCLLFVASEHMIPTARPGHPSSRRSWVDIKSEMDRRKVKA